MKALNQLQLKLDQVWERVQDYLDCLSLRERVLVIFTGIFLLVVGIGSALWYMHQAAEFQNKRLNDLKAFTIDMQQQVVRMKPADDLNLSTAEKIQRAAQQQSLAVTVQPQAQNQFQIITQHENYAVLANFLTQIAQMGVSIEKLDMEKTETQIKLSALTQ